MGPLQCTVVVTAGILPGEPIKQFTRSWNFTYEDLLKQPTYIDGIGSAMNYAISLQDPKKVSWVRYKWFWM